MIRIGSTSREMESDFLLAPGGFAWWYLDLITPEGDGLVLIWSYGLPFLPGYTDSARRGNPQRPIDRPSINVVVYERGRPGFYLLQEYGGMRDAECGVQNDSRAAAECRIEQGCHSREDGGPVSFPGDFIDRIGESTFTSRVMEGRRLVEVSLDCPAPGSSHRLTGTVTIEGIARGGTNDEDDLGARHVWTPLTGPAHGHASLDFGDRPVARLSGRAYHDRNGGRVPLDALGMDRWMWGRFPLGGRELIYYLLWPSGEGAPRFLGVEIDGEGATRVAELEVEVGRERRGLAGMGMRWPVTLRLRRGGKVWADVRHTSTMDHGPFYLRFQSEVTMAGKERALGWSELCDPNRIDLALHRPLVRMRVHHTAARNSIWLPLFTGPRTDRVRRLVRSFLSVPGTA